MVLEEKIIQITDLLEQIASVDKMIHLHAQKGDEKDIMLFQYKNRRKEFLKQLKEILLLLNISPADLAA